MPTQLPLFDADRMREDGDGITPGERIADMYMGSLFEDLAEVGKGYGEHLIQRIIADERKHHSDDPQFMRELENGLRGILADWDCNEDSIRDFWGLPKKGAQDVDD